MLSLAAVLPEQMGMKKAWLALASVNLNKHLPVSFINLDMMLIGGILTPLDLSLFSRVVSFG